MIVANASKSTENQHRVMKIPVGIYPGIDHGMNINGETAGNGIVQQTYTVKQVKMIQNKMSKNRKMPLLVVQVTMVDRF